MQTRRPEPEEETGEEEERAGYRFGEPDETGEFDEDESRTDNRDVQYFVSENVELKI